MIQFNDNIQQINCAASNRRRHQEPFNTNKDY
jgi:hypothetical protein